MNVETMTPLLYGTISLTRIIARGWDGTEGYFYWLTCRYSSTWCHDDPGHGTKIMRGKWKKGDTSNIHLYSLFLSSSRAPE